MSAAVNDEKHLTLRDCGRELIIHRSDVTSGFTVMVFPKRRSRHAALPARSLAYATGEALRLACTAQGIWTLWMVPVGYASAAFDLNVREAERVSEWAGIPMPGKDGNA